MKQTASLLIHPEELDAKWIKRCVDLKIPTLALHPVGGFRAPLTMKAMLDKLETAEFRALIDNAFENGLQIEYEMHAMRYFLPKSKFEHHPEWFRVDENGKRNPDMNCCVSNADALDFIAKRAAETAKKLYRSSHRYFFWADDAHDAFCHCEKCQKLSSSDQQLLLMNRILEEIQKDDPDATLAYLAYYSTLTPPESVKPRKGIFLEYAPIDRDFHKPLADATDAKNAEQHKHLTALLDTFGKDTAKALDYWLDNSLFSNWTKPPKAFLPDEAVIFADFDHYHALGFTDISTFACYLGNDYIELHGEPDITPFAKAFHNR